MSGTHRNNLHWLPPELVLTPHVYRISERKAVAHVNIHPRQPASVVIFTDSEYGTNNLYISLPCQNTKFLDSAWQAEIGGWWLTWHCKREKPLVQWFNDCSQWIIIGILCLLNLGQHRKGFSILALQQIESLYLVGHIRTSLQGPDWKAFPQFCNSWMHSLIQQM